MGNIMKVRLGYLEAIKNTLNKTFNESNLNGKLKFQLALLIDPVSNALTKREEVRQQLIIKYGESSKDNPDTIVVKPENMQNYFNELIELDNTEIELPNIHVDPDDLSTAASLTPLDIKILIDLSKMSEEQTKTQEATKTPKNKKK